MTAIVELKDATVKVNNGFDTEKIILDHVYLTIREGDFITILGGNGAGKSTLFNSHSRSSSHFRILENT